MARAIPSLGELEMQVLRLVWREQPCTERRITEMVQADRPLARTTVLKTMQRLEEKRLLVRQPVESGPILYRAAVPEESVLPTLIRRFVDGVLGGSAGPLAAFLAESGEGRLSARDLAALRAIARRSARVRKALRAADRSARGDVMTALLIEPLDRLARAWIELMAAVAIQALALAALALAASWILRRCSPSLRHGFWLIVAFKLLIMPLWSLPVTCPEFMSWRRQVAAGAGQGERGGGPIVPQLPATPASPGTIESGPSASTIQPRSVLVVAAVMAIDLDADLAGSDRLADRAHRGREDEARAVLAPGRDPGRSPLDRDGRQARRADGPPSCAARARHECRRLTVSLWAAAADPGLTAPLARDDLIGPMAAHPAA